MSELLDIPAPAAIDYGSSARIGVIVPSINSVSEIDFRHLVPAGVECFATRLQLSGGDRDELEMMADQAASAAALLADMRPDLILFHCTAATMVPDHSRAARIVADIEAVAGCPAIVTSDAVVDGLRSLGVASVIVIAPYTPEVVAEEVAFLRSKDIEVPVSIPLALPASEFVAVEPSRWRELAVQAASDCGADAIFLSCANMRALELVESLERELDKPVITSNQAALWGALRALGIDDSIDGYGRLMRTPSLAQKTASGEK